MDFPTPLKSNIAEKYNDLVAPSQHASRRSFPRETSSIGAPKSVSELKEYWLQRLAKKGQAKNVCQTSPSSQTQFYKNDRSDQGTGQNSRLMSAEGVKEVVVQGDVADRRGSCKDQERSRHKERPTFMPLKKSDIEDVVVSCNNCFSMVPASEAHKCSGDQATCPLAMKVGPGERAGEQPTGPFGVLDTKLKKLQAYVEARLSSIDPEQLPARHLVCLKYHIVAALQWSTGAPEARCMGDHTVKKVGELVAACRSLSPSVYIFAKRVENVIVQKERELRKSMADSSVPRTAIASRPEEVGLEKTMGSFTTEIDSCLSGNSATGTQTAETEVTEVPSVVAVVPNGANVANIRDANDLLELKSEVEQRHWFYSQCLSVKSSCPDKTRMRKALISDLYTQVRNENIPVGNWVQWIRTQLLPEGDSKLERGPATTSRAPNFYSPSSHVAGVSGTNLFSSPHNTLHPYDVGGVMGRLDGGGGGPQSPQILRAEGAQYQRIPSRQSSTLKRDAMDG